MDFFDNISLKEKIQLAHNASHDDGMAWFFTAWALLGWLGSNALL